MKEIVVGFEGGEASRHALSTAVRFARDLPDAQLQVVHVTQPPMVDAAAYASPLAVPPRDHAELESQAAEQRTSVEGMLADAGVPWRYHHASGDPARELARIAEELDAHVIVVGTRGHGVLPFLERLLVGSVSRELVRVQARPVLVVPLPHER